MTPKPDDACPTCGRELWIHTRKETAECRAKAGGFAILCGNAGARIVSLPSLSAPAVGLVQICQYCSCPVDGSKDAPSCRCACHLFAPSPAPEPDLERIAALPPRERGIEMLKRAQRCGVCPSGDHLARKCPMPDECCDARAVIENLARGAPTLDFGFGGDSI